MKRLGFPQFICPTFHPRKGRESMNGHTCVGGVVVRVSGDVAPGGEAGGGEGVGVGRPTSRLTHTQKGMTNT